ncbi:MAG: hypothetical protein JWM69_185 [Candidatus Binatus sp.]|jgi:hypothetical protein|nr:hypothetical protein [Candidatus Binatus sp.]
MAAIADGDRIVLIDRRLFKDDNTRIFVGIIEETEGSLVRARGYVFHVSSYEVGGQERRGEERTRVFSMGSGDIVYLLPREHDISKLMLKRTPKSMTLSDGNFAMDLSDFLLRA